MVKDLIPDRSGPAVVAFLKGSKHSLYEDRFRLLSRDVPIVRNSDRGEIFAVFDGIGSAPKGRDAAQKMADLLVDFYRKPETYELTMNGLLKIIQEGNMAIHGWGCIEGSDVPLGGCAGTIVWLLGNTLHVCHVGDTSAALITDTSRVLLTREHQIESGAIYRYFGLGSSLQIDTMSLEVEECDRILIVSDGVTKVLSFEEAIDLVEDYGDISLAAKALVLQAQARGSDDDITVLIVEVEEE